MDYSKRGTCKCKHCRKKIGKGEIKIGKSVEYKEKHILQYYRINCVFKTFRRARLSTNVINNINEINGLHQITGKEKLQITSLIDDANLRKTYPPSRPICNPKKIDTFLKQHPICEITCLRQQIYLRSKLCLQMLIN